MDSLINAFNNKCVLNDIIGDSIDYKINWNHNTKGRGAGGENTNKTGLVYEDITDLETHYKIINQQQKPKVQLIKFKNSSKLFFKVVKNNLFTFLKDEMDSDIEHAHGCKQPDECYIDDVNNIIFIIEKKFQQVSGSVCEKIQTPDFKIWQYRRIFPEYEIVYIFCLSSWFKTNCKTELKYLEYKKIPF